MSLNETWTFVPNQALVDQSTLHQQVRSLWLQITTLLLAHGWSVYKSCDGTSVSTSNLLTTLSSWNWSSSSPHSWIVLKSPEGFIAGPDGTATGDQSRIYFQIDCNNSNVHYISLSAHNTVPVGGTTSAAPTSNTQSFMFNSAQCWRSTLTPTGIFSFGITNSGRFYIVGGFTGTGYAPFVILFPPLKDVNRDAATNQLHPFAAPHAASWFDSAPGPLGIGAPAGLLVYAGGIFRGWAPNGTASAVAPSFEWVYNAALNGPGYNYLAAGDVLSRDWPLSEVRLSTIAAGKVGTIGFLSDIYIGYSTTIGQGQPNDPASIELISFQGFWLPADTLLSL